MMKIFQENITKDLDRLLKNQAHLETEMKNLNQILYVLESWNWTGQGNVRNRKEQDIFFLINQN